MSSLVVDGGRCCSELLLLSSTSLFSLFVDALNDAEDDLISLLLPGLRLSSFDEDSALRRDGLSGVVNECFDDLRGESFGGPTLSLIFSFSN